MDHLSRMRVAFVGQSVYFAQCALSTPSDGIEPKFIDFRASVSPGPLMTALQTFDPDVVLVFRPEIVPAGLFSQLRAVTIGYLTEPIPRGSSPDHPDLGERLRWLNQVDPENFDRIISFDPLIADTAGKVLPVWRSLPIPVEDSLFMDVHERGHPPRLLFLGRSTEHREHLLAPIKRQHPLVQVGHGLFGAELDRFLRWADVQFNLHNNPYPTFENRVCIALAAGHLVISETLSPTHGLRPGQDYLEVEGSESLLMIVDELAREPDAHAEVQRSGRKRAERFRASRVYPQLIRDALMDVQENGNARRHA